MTRRYLADPGFDSRPEAVPGLGGLQTVIGYVAWACTAACLIGLILAGAQMAVAHRRGSSDSFSRLGGVVAGCLIIGAASSLVGGLLGFNLFTSTAKPIPGLQGVQTIIRYTSWVAGGICLIGLLVAGAMMAISYRQGQDQEHMSRLAGVGAGCLIVGGASAIVAALIP